MYGFVRACIELHVAIQNSVTPKSKNLASPKISDIPTKTIEPSFRKVSLYPLQNYVAFPAHL